MDGDDGAIVERVLAGDRDAFGILIDRHRSAARRLALRILRVRADAEDVVQEALLHAFLDLRELRARDRFVAWLLGIVVNLARSHLRARRETPVEDWAGGRAVAGLLWIDAEPSPADRQEARELHDRVWKALGELPPEQQEAVQLHYVEGLRVWEIAALVGLPSGTVKARLHRARGRLRRLLAAELGAAGLPAPAREEEIGMIEVIVDDVIVRAPRDEPVRYATPAREGNLGRLHVILLKEREGERVLPIWVGHTEGSMIALKLAGIGTPRPMSLMLMARVLELAEIKVERVVVTTLRDNIFHASLGVRIADRLHEVDARPSDAITLALYHGASIFVTPEMLALPIVINAGTALPQLEEYHERKQAEQHREPEVPAMEWRSFRSLPDPRASGG
jgi:RNA polymerase sigma-70 factor (ECF subfamily)